MRTFNRILFQLGISTTLLCTLPLAMTQTKRTGPSVTSVTVTPNPVVLYVSQSLQLGLTITGTGSYTKQVTWSTTGGLVSSTGYYTAPATPGAFNVTAKSVATGNPSSTILVQVNAMLLSQFLGQPQGRGDLIRCSLEYCFRSLKVVQQATEGHVSHEGN